MNKKLLTVAIGAALAAAPMLAAQADVKVYGRLQAEVANVTVGGDQADATTSNITSHAGVSRGSTRTILNDTGMGRFGIAADEDLGGGLKAVGLIEFAVDTADGQSTNANTAGSGSALTGTQAQALAAREIYVGLDHKAAGSLQFGRFNSPYLNTGVALDPFVATMLEARNNMGMSGNADGFGVMNGHSSFVGDGLRYTSPKLVGIQAVVYLGVDGTGSAASCTIANGSAANTCNVGTAGVATNGDLSASLGWAGGPASVFVAYNKMANVAPTATTKPEPTSKKIGAQFKFGDSVKNTISLQYEKINRDTGAPAASAGDEAVFMFFGYQAGIGNTTIAVQWGAAVNDQTNAADTVQKAGGYFAVGAIYNFSKTARVFGGLRGTALLDSQATNDKYRDESVYTLGVRKDF